MTDDKSDISNNQLIKETLLEISKELKKIRIENEKSNMIYRLIMTWEIYRSLDIPFEEDMIQKFLDILKD